MNKQRLAFLVVTLLLGADAPPEVYDSPRLARLAKTVKTGDKDAIDVFWSEVQGKAPLIEPAAGDDSQCRVTFLFRGTSTTRSVGLRGGIPGAAEFKMLTQLPGTDLWYRTERFPRDARFTYFFVLDPPGSDIRDLAEAKAAMSRIRMDPLNARTHAGRPIVELPGVSPQPLLEHQPEVPKGKLSAHKLSSAILKEERSFSLYTPPGYDPKNDPCDLLILFDGPAYKTEIPAPVIVDNLLAQKKIRPLVMVLVDQKDRLKELACSESFADFLAKELVPWVRKSYGVSAKPAQTIIGGFSVGGLMAAYCGLRHADVFGNVLSQSGSYWFFPGALGKTGPPWPYEETGWLTARYVDAPRQPVRFYLEVGRFEVSFVGSQLSENRRFRDVLRAKGYDVTYSEFNGGHDGFNWRGTFAQGLLALVGTADKKN